MIMRKYLQKIRTWFFDHESAIMTISGMVVVGLLCYVFGWFTGAQTAQRPITVFRATQDPIIVKKNSSDSTNAMRPEDCVYVGSVKGTKYYPPDCSYATKIDPENLRCFRSDQNAIEKGYTKSTSCK
jgi:hypothetical protein